MDTRDLQQLGIETYRYAGAVDGVWGRLTDALVLLALSDGPDTKLSPADFDESAKRLGVQAAAIRAFWQTEAAGAGFQDGKPKILPEPHRFSRATNGIFDKSYPKISYPRWGTQPYPKTQDARYDTLLQWCRLLSKYGFPIDAAFASCSYGAPQIMGENFAMCGFPDPISFAFAMARDEQHQLVAFERFVTKKGILPALRKVDRTEASWDPVSAPYNGTAFRVNGYSGKMRNSFISFGGK